ncbi:MAG: hypothetical protein HY000_14870 [Planctomycetes bacterium]|nr:hypothetical protein [Planctomycetota bacterium]
MNCEIALRLMEVCRPSGEDLVDPELASLSVHLEECPECLGRLRTRQAFDAQVVKALRSVAMPEGLRERILDRLDGSVIRSRRLRIIRYAAAALLLVGVGLSVWAVASNWGQKDVVQFDKLSVLAKAELVDLQDRLDAPARIQDAAGVMSWCVGELEKLDLHVHPPRDWSLSGLIGIAQYRFAGRPVAVFRYDDPSYPGTPSAFVFVWPRQQPPIQGIDSIPRLISQTPGLTAFAWMEGDMNYVAVFKGRVPKEFQRLMEQQGLT